MAARLRFAAGLGLMFAASVPVAFADDKKSALSIYDDQVETVDKAPKEVADPAPAESTNLTQHNVNGVTLRSTPVLEDTVQTARKWLAKETDFVQDQVDSAFKQYLHVEHNVTSTVAGLRAESEDVLPGGIYILVAALSGTIFARRSNVVLRALTPLAFGTAAFSYFLPKTFANTRALVWEFEQKSPELAKLHLQTEQAVCDAVKTTNSALDSGKQGLEDSVRAARKLVADTTGLAVSDKKK